MYFPIQKKLTQFYRSVINNVSVTSYSLPGTYFMTISGYFNNLKHIFCNFLLPLCERLGVMFTTKNHFSGF